MKKQIVLIVALIITLAFIGVGRVMAVDQLSKQDKTFIQEASSGGLFEVKMGEVAEKQASGEKVKDFGRKMVADHSSANKELMNISQKVGFTPPGAMNEKDQRSYDALSKLNGADFDRAYMKNMVSDHENDIAAFQKESKEGKNGLVKQFVENTLPILQHHLQMAKEIRAELEK
jgi:putative membrane protein